jgi:hypothetical protein
MSLVPFALIVIFVVAIIGIAWGILRFLGSVSKRQLRGRYTWADEIAVLKGEHHSN